nr:DUF1835 domain-containing protein [uncultured Draconibacterium sp.]
MRKQYHILNGDSLKEHFPESIQGKIIVAKECLVDGSVKGKSLTDFFKTRAEFISSNYDGCTEQDYFEKTVPEFQKMQKIPDYSDINLWFEDDLFCQVNFWFTVNLIFNSLRSSKVFLIRPAIHNQFGFGGLSEIELINAYKQKTQITELDKIALLWNFYQNNDIEELVKTANKLAQKYPFILNAVEAHINRIPNENGPGRPKQTLIEIMNELGTDSFGAVFKEFNKRESIYGFGDLQVKRLFDEVKNNG